MSARNQTTHRTGKQMSKIATSRRVRGLLAGAAVLGLFAAGTPAALADPDPTNPGTPPAGLNPSQIYAGVGADAFAELTDNLATQYNAANPSSPQIASYDAVNPKTGAAGEQITTKPGCTVTRPNGANAGMTLFKLNGTSTAAGYTDQYCVDFVRSSRAKLTDGSENGLLFYAQSEDAVGYATLGNAYAPTTPLTTSQLADIFTCTDTDWSQVGGQAGPIHVYLPPTSAATLTFFLSAIGITINDITSGCGASGTIAAQQNDGRTLAGDPEGITPYAVTKWAAQQNADLSTGAPAGIPDNRGGSQLGLINSTVSPTTTSTLDSVHYTVLNPAFSTANPSYARLLYNVTRSAQNSPADLRAIFAPGGFLCTHEDELLIPFGNQPLGTDQSAAHYCGQTS